MKVSSSIMAHPNRLDAVHLLQRQLDRPVSVHWDREGAPSGNGDRVWRQAKAAWEMFDPDADWHVLLQDDALVCDDFLAGMEQALEHVPRTAVVSPYLGQGSRSIPARWAQMAARAASIGASWVRSDRVLWGVSLAVPTAMIPEMIAWADLKGGMPDDMRVGAWAVRRQSEVWYPWPSLVDHLPMPSLTKHKAADRRARQHHAGSALELDWTGAVVSDPMLIRRSGPRSAPARRRREAPA